MTSWHVFPRAVLELVRYSISICVSSGISAFNSLLTQFLIQLTLSSLLRLFSFTAAFQQRSQPNGRGGPAPTLLVLHKRVTAFCIGSYRNQNRIASITDDESVNVTFSDTVRINIYNKFQCKSVFVCVFRICVN